MCRVCEGFTIDDVMALDAVRIAEVGYGIQGVIAPSGDHDDGVGAWAYTVGLLDAAGHPEMIIAGVAPDLAASVLSVLAQSALEGERYLVGETIDLGGPIARVGYVHDVQYELGTFSTWFRLIMAGVLRESTLDAVQIILPVDGPPFGARSSQPLLSLPEERVDIVV